MLKFLIVDDDADFHELHRMTVARSKLPLQIIEAEDGEEAFRILDDPDRKPDLVLLDINMPRMSGYEFLGEYAPRTTPVVMLTGSYESSDRIKTMHTFDIVKRYFVKPLTAADFGELAEMVEQLKNS